MNELDILVTPFAPAPRVSAETREAIQRIALEANDRYVHEFLEKYSFCPYAKPGREKGETVRQVYYAETTSIEPLLCLMEEVAARDQIVVSQIIFPIIDVGPAEWMKFCYKLTELGHARIGKSVLAIAPLHPRLPFNMENPYALVPLFRRTPDPTIQWVRLDGLEALKDTGKKRFIAPEDIGKLTEDPKPRVSVYERTAETNMAMTKRLSVEAVVAMLAGFQARASEEYARALEADSLSSPAASASGPG